MQTRIEVRYYATFDEDDRPIGFYPTDIWTDEMRPPEAIEISEQQYLDYFKPKPLEDQPQ